MLCLVVLMWAALPARAEVRVLASIKPMALIAQQVVGERGRAESLLDGSASPHDYPMRASDIRRLKAADLVLWVGPELETFLSRPLANLPADKVLEAQRLGGIFWPRLDAEEQEHREHFHERDPHLWLDPRNGALIALELARRLGKLDPEGSEVYLANARALQTELEVLDRHLAERLLVIADRGFAVYHEGYSHFVQRYHLKQLGYVTFGPEQRPGARHLYRLRQQLATAQCLFTEPYYGTDAALALADELSLTLGELDPLGAGVDSYPELLESMAEDFLECLAP